MVGTKRPISYRGPNHILLGLGIIHFKEHEPEQGEVVTYDYVYRVNTQVITSVTVRGGQSDPDYPASVRLI